MHANCSRLGDGLNCSGQFGCDGHHANCSRRRVPILPEEFFAWLNEVFRRMYAALGVADERSCQMNAERTGSPRASILRDCPAQMLQGAQDAVFGSCDRRWEIAGDSMPCHPGLYGGQSGIVGFHYIVTEATM